MMLNPRNDLLPLPSSPTISSVSSSDLDTESTGSFFHDRSTTLGSLMGVAFPSISLRPPSRREIRQEPAAAGGGGCRKSAEERQRRRRRWWGLCRDDAVRTVSLGEFLKEERRSGDDTGGAFYDAAAELEGIVAEQPQDRCGGSGRVLFADGRVLPPPATDEESSAGGGFYRFPVSLTGICCSGGAWMQSSH